MRVTEVSKEIWRGKAGRPRLDPKKAAHIAELLVTGKSLRQIARELGCGYGTVHRMAKGDPKLPRPIQNSKTGIRQ